MKHSPLPIRFVFSFNLKRGFIVVTLVLSIFVFTHSNVQAASTTCISAACAYNVHFDGAERDATGWGATANVGDYQVKGVCISSAAWALIGNQSKSTAFAQSGYLRLASWSTTTTYYFYEYGDSSTAYQPVMLGADTKNWGSSDKFTTYYNSSNQYTEMLINNTVEVYAFLDWNANDQEWFSEVHSNEDYIVGGTKHHSLFGSLEYLQNGSWHTITASNYMYNDMASGAYSTSGDAFYVWDKRVS